MIISVLTVLILLTTYFIIAYFLSIRTFNAAQDVIGALEIILYKGSCYDQTLNFLRGDDVRNSTLTVTSASDNLLS